jgi:hypothetical protein
MPIPITTRQVSRLQDIDFIYIGEQIAKCDERIAAADFEQSPQLETLLSQSASIS